LKVKEKALCDKFTSATAIAERVLVDVVDQTAPVVALPTVRNIARAANFNRRKHRAQEPKDLTFSLDVDKLPIEFFQVSNTLIHFVIYVAMIIINNSFNCI
jgi:hypothetical protein